MDTHAARFFGNRLARKAWRRAALIPALTLVACSNPNWQPPTVILDNPDGPSRVLYASPSSQFQQGPLTAPQVPPPGTPPGLSVPPDMTATQAFALPQPPLQSRNGVYAGTAEPLATAGGLCIQNRPVSGFVVNNGAVRWGGFRGTVGPDGGVQMVYGSTWLFGQFDGDAFRGQISTNRMGDPGCSWVMTLTKIGR